MNRIQMYYIFRIKAKRWPMRHAAQSGRYWLAWSKTNKWPAVVNKNWSHCFAVEMKWAIETRLAVNFLDASFVFLMACLLGLATKYTNFHSFELVTLCCRKVLLSVVHYNKYRWWHGIDILFYFVCSAWVLSV